MAGGKAGGGCPHPFLTPGPCWDEFRYGVPGTLDARLQRSHRQLQSHCQTSADSGPAGLWHCCGAPWMCAKPLPPPHFPAGSFIRMHAQAALVAFPGQNQVLTPGDFLGPQTPEVRFGGSRQVGGPDPPRVCAPVVLHPQVCVSKAPSPWGACIARG